MNITQDDDQFDKQQRCLLDYIASAVRQRLEEAGLHDDRELVENLVFGLTAIIDSSAVMDIDGKPLRPFLTFARDEEPQNLIAPTGRGSWMHEYACPVVEEMFRESTDESA